MSVPQFIAPDFSESFPHLSKAPIVEAVLQIDTRAGIPWEEELLRPVLSPRLPDYPQIQSQREIHGSVKIHAGQSPEQSIQDLGWKGLRFLSSDGKRIAQFHRDVFSFSRLAPYEGWDTFSEEALRLWGMHVEVAKPSELIQRLGVRFINRVEIANEGVHLEDYLTAYPREPRGLELPYMNFFHQDTFVVPETPFAINLTRTLQAPEDPTASKTGLIIDVDVFAVQPFPLENLLERLEKMRWLKNKAFFGSIVDGILETFR